MATSLLIHDRIRTTDAKAKELRKYVEKMITLARKAKKAAGVGEDKNQVAKALHYRRQALQFLRLPRIDASNPDDRAERKELLDKLFVDLAERYADRPGGYTRVLKVGNRRGDGAPVSMIEFVEEALEEAKPAKKKSKKKASQKKQAPKAEKAAKAEETTEEVDEATEEPEVEAAAETEAATEEPAAEETASEEPAPEEPTPEPEAETEPEPEPEESEEEGEKKES
jgi:large subunit ribosomal protein L17